MKSRVVLRNKRPSTWKIAFEEKRENPKRNSILSLHSPSNRMGQQQHSDDDSPTSTKWNFHSAKINLITKRWQRSRRALRTRWRRRSRGEIVTSVYLHKNTTKSIFKLSSRWDLRWNYIIWQSRAGDGERSQKQKKKKASTTQVKWELRLFANCLNINKMDH